MSNALAKFSKTTLVNSSGELVVNGGRFARGAVLLAYEMIGGTEALAEWAEENKGDFYTKLFGKVIGREVEHNVSDSVEDLLEKLDAGALDTAIIDVTPEHIEDAVMADEPAPRPKKKLSLKKFADMYAGGEPDEEEQESYEA